MWGIWHFAVRNLNRGEKLWLVTAVIYSRWTSVDDELGQPLSGSMSCKPILASKSRVGVSTLYVYRVNRAK